MTAPRWSSSPSGAGVGDLDSDDLAVGVPAGMAVPAPPGTVRVGCGRPTWPVTTATPSREPVGSNPGFRL
jgi:hypothetical protein